VDRKVITVITQLKVKDGLSERLNDELLALVATTRSEEGCISYTPYQSIEDKSTFILYEIWSTRNDWDKHMEMPYYNTFFFKILEFLAAPIKVTLWDILGQDYWPTGRQ
jgi:quinol monooxygenase YgiN